MKVLIYPGSFKPPHKGHVRLLQDAIEQVKPDQVKILIGTKSRGIYDYHISRLVWTAYKACLFQKTTLVKSKEPVSDTYEICKGTDQYFVLAGKEDSRFDYFTQHPDKFGAVQIISIPRFFELSAKQIREHGGQDWLPVIPEIKEFTWTGLLNRVNLHLTKNAIRELKQLSIKLPYAINQYGRLILQSFTCDKIVQSGDTVCYISDFSSNSFYMFRARYGIDIGGFWYPSDQLRRDYDIFANDPYSFQFRYHICKKMLLEENEKITNLTNQLNTTEDFQGLVEI